MRPSRMLALICATVVVLFVLFGKLLGLGHREMSAPASAQPGSGPIGATLETFTEGPGEPRTNGAGALQRDALVASTAADSLCRIRVVLAATQAPVPDARLWIQRDDVDWRSQPWKQAMRRFNEIEQVLQSGLGQELVLDARGEVFVPRPARELAVAAARGELHGDASLMPEESEWIVELKPYRSLSCQVVDRAGLPVEGAFVALNWGEFDPLAHQWTWISDAEGRVWIPKLENQLWPAGYEGPLGLSLAAGLPSEPEFVAFTTETVPIEPVQLVAGDSASVVLQLTDPQGRELSLDGYANLEVMCDVLPDAPLALRGGANVYMPLLAGKAVFERVALGQALEVSASADGRRTVRRELRGPTHAGEVLRVLMPLGERRRIARGRVLGMEESMRAATPRGARLVGRAAESGESFETWIASAGPFEGRLYSAASDRAPPAWTLELAPPGQPGGYVVVTPRIDADDLDFGDVAFEPAPLLARVRVVDDAGAPVPNAALEIEQHGLRSSRWCDEGGACSFWGPPADLPFEVHAECRGWLPSEPARVEVAGSEHPLVLRRGATLEGSLLLPRGVAFDDFELELTASVHALQSGTPSQHAKLVEGHRFRFEACEPGLASLKISCCDQTVLERSGIEVRAGATTRLEPIDLRGVLHPIALSFELASGEPWTSGHLESLDLDGETTVWRRIDASARASFLGLAPSVDLWVAAFGARPKWFEGVADGDHLVLPTPLSVLLRLPARVRLPAPPLVLEVRAERVAPEDVPLEVYDEIDVTGAVVGMDGIARLHVPWPGDYELKWILRHTGTNAEFAIEAAERQSIPVADSASSEIVEAHLSPQAVAEAIASAGG